MFMDYTCHNGGAVGSDMFWENEGMKYGVKTIAYSFYRHVQESKNQKILTAEELNEGYEAVKIANKTLKRNPERQYQYVQNLLSRNWFQVKNSEAVFAIGMLLNSKTVKGGTGWAVQMAINNKKPVFVFDQKTKSWYNFNYVTNEFDVIDYIPKLTENFAGIGTREINENGMNAIKDIYEKNFENVCS